jgi:hypothetical protein
MINRRIFDKPCIYQILVKGLLDSEWSDFFDDLTISPQPDDETLLSGPVADQAALHGVLAKIRNLGLPLLSVKRVEGQDCRSEASPSSGIEDHPVL